ncbi:MAG: hypothetical protein VW397_00095 [Candidatus Margulisiibacteriota bacterium]
MQTNETGLTYLVNSLNQANGNQRAIFLFSSFSIQTIEMLSKITSHPIGVCIGTLVELKLFDDFFEAKSKITFLAINYLLINPQLKEQIRYWGIAIGVYFPTHESYLENFIHVTNDNDIKIIFCDPGLPR